MERMAQLYKYGQNQSLKTTTPPSWPVIDFNVD